MSDPATPDAAEPPTWAGAPGFHPDAEPEAPAAESEPRPGYQRAGHLPPHAPMPGAPPYPAATALPPVAPRGPGRGLGAWVTRLLGRG